MENNTTNPVNEQDDFTTFKESLLCAVRSELARRGLPSDLMEQDVLLPGKHYRGVSAAGAGQAGAIANLDRLYEEYDGTNLKELAEEAVATLTRKTDIAETVDWITDYEQVRPRLFARLVNAERNKELLRSAPHRRAADLAVAYSAVVSTEEDTLASTTLTNENAAKLGVTEEQLCRDAVANMRAMGDWIVENLYKMTGDADTGLPLFVLTGTRPNGAANILVPEAQDTLTGILGEKFMILPSSIHELICLPYAEEGAEELEKLIGRVNETCVDPAEVLGDKVYVFDRKKIRVFQS